MMAEALQPLQRALRSQDQGSAPRSTAPTPPQSRPATPQPNPPPREAWQNQSQRNGQGPRAGNANQSAGTPRNSPSLRVEVVLMADPERHPTSSGINDSFSNALSPRRGLFVNVVDAMSVVP